MHGADGVSRPSLRTDPLLTGVADEQNNSGRALELVMGT
ncbi:protein of unknown function [Nitrospira japonica]|uniref:Uncharacterized protein n=1 Tax=Nitrospira japonica TaxID=1325564 RepID=A0A1W1I8W0_9BACT|nr:protein of unknown function [Nitrospira japonica]